MSKVIDMHIHSNCSDGEYAVDKLYEKIKAAGIEVFALTDHDTLKGCNEMERLCKESGMRFIYGVEFSCLIDINDPDSDCHILGLNYDYNNPAVVGVAIKNAENRRKKLNDLLDYLKDKFNITLPEDAVMRLAQIENFGKPHLADEMKAAGIVDSKEEAFKKYLDDFMSLRHISAKEAIEAIIEAGGTPVWAHPIGDNKDIAKHDMGDKFANQLKSMMEFGIKGLECCYSRYTDEEIAFLVTTAKNNGLFISGGSDFHGEMRKPGVILGHTGLTSYQQDCINILEAFK